GCGGACVGWAGGGAGGAGGGGGASADGGRAHGLGHPLLGAPFERGSAAERGSAVTDSNSSWPSTLEPLNLGSCSSIPPWPLWAATAWEWYASAIEMKAESR